MGLTKDADILWARRLRKRGDIAATRAMLDAGPADKDEILRAYLVRTLGLSTDVEMTELVSKYLLEDPEGVVRSMAAQALGQLKSSWAVPQLIQALSDTDRSVREAAALALGAIGDPHAVRALSEILARDESAMVRSSAADSLGEIGDQAARDPLVDALNDKRLLVRRSAVLAIIRTGGERDAERPLRQMKRGLRNLLIWPAISRALRTLEG